VKTEPPQKHRLEPKWQRIRFSAPTWYPKSNKNNCKSRSRPLPIYTSFFYQCLNRLSVKKGRPDIHSFYFRNVFFFILFLHFTTFSIVANFLAILVPTWLHFRSPNHLKYVPTRLQACIKLSQQRNPNRRGIWNSKRQIDVVTF